MKDDLITTYQKFGFSFIPLRKKSKRPLFDWAVYQTRCPTQEEIDDWRAKGLLGQVAIVCGAVSGVLVFDVDDPDQFDEWRSKQGYNLPPTPVVRTSGKKYHAYFKHPGGKIKNMVKQIPGADIKADGGYVVAPPSVHPNGSQYEWVEFLGLDDVDLADLPEWLKEFIEQQITGQVELSKDDLLPPEEDLIAKALRGASHGARNNTAIKLAGYYIGKGEPEPRVLEMLRGWNLKNSEPLPDKELSRIVASAARMEARKRIREGTGLGVEQGELELQTDLPWEEGRQAALQGLGARLKIPLTDIKITKSDDSIIEFILGEAGSVVISMAEIVDQRNFKRRFAAAGLMIPEKVREPKTGGAWDAVVRLMIKLATVQDVGDESSALGELQEFLNNYIEHYRGLQYFRYDQDIPPHSICFIIQRKDEPPRLYLRASELFIDIKSLGYKCLRKFTVLLPSLGHEKEQFKWNRKNVRAWNLDLNRLSQQVKELVYQKAVEGKLNE